MSSINENGRNGPFNHKIRSEEEDNSPVNPHVKNGFILVSKCCQSEALYRISEKYGFDMWEFCPQCLELCDWDEVKEEEEITKIENEDMTLHKEHLPNYDEMVKGNLSGYELIMEVLDDDGFYDGHYDDLMPWTFSLSDFQHPDREIELLFDVWNAKEEDLNLVKGCLSDGGYIYYVEAHALLYEIVITPNMGLDSINIIATEEEI